MASLFKPTYTVNDPKTGKRITRKASKWYGQYQDGDGITRRVPLAKDKSSAQMMLNELTKRSEQQRAGFTDPFNDHRKRPLTMHLDDFEKALRSKGGIKEHVQVVSARAGKVIVGCEFIFIPDIIPSSVEGFISGLKASGKSIHTFSFRLAAVKQFARWLVRDRRANDNTIAEIGEP